MVGCALRKIGVLALKAETTFFTCARGDLGEPCGRRRLNVVDEGTGVVVVSVGVTDALPVRPVNVDVALRDGVPLYPLVSE